ncbi:MAG: outer membrane protein assembly factor BamD [Janthinobacterium lividum]
MSSITGVSRALLRTALPCALLLGGCSTLSSILPWNGNTDALNQRVDLSKEPPEQLYNNGVDALNRKDYGIAVTQFDAVQQNYPYSPWAVNAQLMDGYAEYLRNHYTDAVAQLDRYIQLHPASKDAAYAYYLRALCFYEQIADVQRDQKGTQEAMVALQEVVNRYPDSAYGRDSRLKIDLCRDHLAGKEMEIGRYYEKQQLYAAAIGRFQRVVDNYQTTNHVPEALHRLTEIYLRLGLTDQARKTASVLAYNYPGNRWYQDSWNDLVAQDVVQGRQIGTADPNTKSSLVARAFGWIF